jgi:hypothetical protein
MDGLIDIDAARALVSDAALWPRVRDFLWNFAPQIHPSWLKTIPSLSSIPSIPSSPRVSRWLLSELKVAPCFHPFPASDLSRLLLLDSDTLVSIVHWLGALATSDALRRVTRGPDVAALKAALPDAYPAVFSFAPYFAKSGLLTASDDPAPAAVLTTGYSLLFAALSHLPPPLLRRLTLKLPADAPLPPLRDSASPREQSTIKPSNHQTIKLLLKLHFPEAFALCCS